MNKFGVLLGIVCIFLIHNLDGVYGDEECPSDVIDDLNKKIEDALSKHPDREDSTLTLLNVYHDRYENLKRAKVMAHAKQSDCDNAKNTLEMFLEIASEIENVIDRMQMAVDTLTKVQLNQNSSDELKYNALSVKTAIKYSTSAKEAEAALERYETFKKENNIAEAPDM